MKLMKDMNRDEIIELVATVSFRIWGFIYALEALRSIYQWELLNANMEEVRAANDYQRDILHFYLGDFYFYFVTSVILFLLSVFLPRFHCCGLSLAMDMKPSE